jgi:hypothetical protein
VPKASEHSSRGSTANEEKLLRSTIKLTILTYNTLFAGWDGADDRRAQAQVELISSLNPDVFLMQEAKHFEAGGNALLHALEARIGMRGFLANAPRTGQNIAIFIRDPLTPLSFEAYGTNFHHTLATLKVKLPETDRPLTLISAHLCQTVPPFEGAKPHISPFKPLQKLTRL